MNLSAGSEITFQPIGILHTPFQERAGMPIQPTGASGIEGTAEIYPEFAAGLEDLEGFSHLILLYHLHRVGAPKLQVIPFLDTVPHGIFATRAPTRPNPIGLSVVRLRARAGGTLFLENVDMLDGTPLLDIKPYVPEFDGWAAERIGWMAQARGRVRHQRSDERFD